MMMDRIKYIPWKCQICFRKGAHFLHQNGVQQFYLELKWSIEYDKCFGYLLAWGLSRIEVLCRFNTGMTF